VSVTPSWVQRYQERIGVETSLIYNGYEPGMFEGVEDNESNQSGSNDSDGDFHIVYSGSMSYHQRPTLFFEAIKELVSNKGSNKELKITFIGNYAPFLSNMVVDYGLESIVEFVPFGSMQTAVSYMKQADMLLINGVQGEDDGVIPSKLFDYFGARKPILGFDLSGNAESLLHESRQGYSFHVSKDSPSHVASTILNVMKGDFTTSMGEFDPSIYSREAQTQQLAQIFDDVWSRRHH
jgi:glycosyltransferase involved in cell wall biosynthesis